MARESMLIQDVFPQELTIQLSGADVLRLGPHASADEEAPLPDFGSSFARAARLGLFGGREVAPWAAQADVVSSSADLKAKTQTWRLRLGGIDRGAFLILANVLRSIDLDELLLETGSKARPPPPLLDLQRLSYPARYAQLPFELQAEPPQRSGRDRLVQIVFAAPPPDGAVEGAIGALELWSQQLVMLGGYAEPGTDTRKSGCMPDAAFQLDEVTVELAFPDFFQADEAAFSAVVNHAAWLHHQGFGVSAVVVR
jgi:hypothetical protein